MRDPASHLAVLQASSGIISLPASTPEGRQSSQLQLLHSASLPCTDTAQKTREDQIAFAGGPVWAIDACPELYDEQLHFTVAAHPRGREQNAMAVTTAGPVLLQIWSLPVRPPTSSTAVPHASPRRDPRLPSSTVDKKSRQNVLRFNFGIALDGGIVRDCRWCPDKKQIAEVLGGAQKIATSLGLLAVVLGTGEIQLLWVPHSVHSPEHEEHSDDGVSIMEAQLAAALSAEDLGGSCASCLEWLPCQPHDLIIVGCFDGTAAMLRLLPGSAAGSDGGRAYLQAVLHFSTDVDPIRAVAWAHPSICSRTSDSAGRFLFATTGHSSQVHVWDARDPAHAIAKFAVPGRTWVLALIWTPIGLLAVQDDGSLHILNLGSQPSAKDTNVASFTSDLAGALWDVCHHSWLEHVAYAGADGEVLIAEKDFQAQRTRPAHEPVAGFREEAGVLQVCARAEMARVSGAFSGRNATRVGSRVASPREAVHRVRWLGANASDPTNGAWLAHAGAEGLLRCQYLDFS